MNTNKYMDNADYFSGDVKLELSDDNKKAIISIPLITAGINKKNIVWDREVLREISDKFRGVVFKYDVNGSQGSSHVPEHLYSPFYDVGWTYDDVTGSYFDGNQLWVKGEVTKPDVVEKLSRIGANNKRELNAASSGVLLDYNYVVCTICGKKANTCEHKRGEIYNGQVAGIRPTSGKAVSRALHVALTNDPADGEAVIKEVLLQELRELKKDNNKNNINKNEMGDKEMLEEEKKPIIEEEVSKEEEKKEEILEDKEEKIETAEDDKPKTEKKGMITCPKCGHKFGGESAEMSRKDSIPAAKDVNAVPKDNMASKVGSNDESTAFNRTKTEVQGRIENADLLEKKYTTRVVKNIKTQCKRLGRNIVEMADMSISQLEVIEKTLETTPSPKVQFDGQDLNAYGAPAVKDTADVEFADMSADQQRVTLKEVSNKYGQDAGFALACGNKDYVNRAKKLVG